MKKGKLFIFGLLVVILALALVGCDFLLSNDDSSSDGGGGANPTITIRNNTGYAISGIYIIRSTGKQTYNTSWGDNLCGYSFLSNGSSREFALSQPLSVINTYDILIDSIAAGQNITYIKFDVKISNGMTIIFNNSDFHF